jgi:hypothetical protein
MRSAVRSLRVLCLMLLVVMAVAPRRAIAGPFELGGRDWEGLGDFIGIARTELADGQVVPTGTLDFKALSPDDGVILFHPTANLDVESLSAFMRGGGRVILLDDYGSGGALLEHFKLSRVPMPARPTQSLRNRPELAIAEPVSAHPVTNDVKHVVTNHATGLSHPGLSSLLAVHAVGEPDVLVAVAGMVGQGRLLAVGDPSILINNMLRYPGNRQFGKNLVHYAVEEDSWGKRNGKLYILSNALTQKGGDPGLLGDDTRARLRAFTDSLKQMRKTGMPPEAAYAGAVLAGLGLVLWVGSRAGRTHKPKEPRFVRATSLVAQGGAAGHAAVLLAPETSRVLAMMELKSALEEELTARLGLDRVPGPERLVQAVESKRLLGSEALAALRQLLLRMGTIETMVLSERAGAMKPVADKEVVEASRSVERILAEAARS